MNPLEKLRSLLSSDEDEEKKKKIAPPARVPPPSFRGRNVRSMKEAMAQNRLDKGAGSARDEQRMTDSRGGLPATRPTYQAPPVAKPIMQAPKAVQAEALEAIRSGAIDSDEFTDEERVLFWRLMGGRQR